MKTTPLFGSVYHFNFHKPLWPMNVKPHEMTRYSLADKVSQDFPKPDYYFTLGQETYLAVNDADGQDATAIEKLHAPKWGDSEPDEFNLYRPKPGVEEKRNADTAAYIKNLADSGRLREVDVKYRYGLLHPFRLAAFLLTFSPLNDQGKTMDAMKRLEPKLLGYEIRQKKG